MRRFFLSRWGIIISAFILIAVFFGFDRISALQPVKNLGLRVASPFLSASTALQQRTRNAFSFFSSRNDLWEENQRLREQIQELSAEQAALQQTLEGLALLREERDFLAEKNFSAVPAKVIGRLSIPFSDALVINRGNSHGITVGDAVISNAGILVGKIAEASAVTSTVLPITHIDSEFAARVGNAHASLGVVKGSHGISTMITLIPQGEVLTQGDTITTSGTEGRIPANLLIGTVDMVTYIEGDLFQSATLKLPVSLSDVSLVSVIIP